MKFNYKSRFVEARRAFADASSGKGSSVTCGTRIHDKGKAEACTGRVPSRSRKATAYADYGDAARIAEGLLSKARRSRRYNPTFSYEQISEWFGVSLDDVMNIADSINRELNAMKGVACSSLSRSGVSLTLHHGVTPTAAQRAATSSMVRGGAPIEFRAELGMFMLKVDEKDQVVEKGHATADVYVNANSIEEAEQKSYRAVEKYGKGKGWDEVHVFRTIIFPSSHPPVGKRDMPEDEHWEITAGTKRKASAMFLGIDDALTREQQAKVSDAFQAAVHEAVSYANDHLPDNYSATRLCFGNNLFYAIGSERDDVAGPYDPDKYGPFLFDVSVDVSMKDVSDKDPTLTFRIDEVKGKGGERTGRNLLRKDLRLSEFLGMSKPAFLLRATDTDVIGEAVARAFRGTKATASTAKKCVK